MAINPAMMLGTKWEPAARALHYFETELDMQPAELVHPTADYIRASLDGYLPNMFFLEIKYMGEKNFDRVVFDQKPLEHHWIQMQHQCLVTNVSAGTYVPYTLNEDKSRIAKIAYIPVKADDDYLEILFTELTKFWQEVLECRSR